MSVLLYWKERLEAQNPLFNDKLRVPMLNVRPMPGMDPRSSWPRAVARSALYQDYQDWHKDQFLALYRGIQWTGEMPKPAEELIFFSTMAEWLYVVGKEEQVRTYLVPNSVRYEGRWLKGKKNRYFVRLLDWEYHAAQFELTTGIFCFNDEMTGEERVRKIEEARKNYREVLYYNRNKFSGAEDSDDADAYLDRA
jgi:hypothetical protein